MVQRPGDPVRHSWYIYMPVFIGGKMSFDPLTAAFDLGKIAIEKLWPDPTKRAEEMRKLEELRQTGDLARLDAHVKLMLGQIEVNKVEAAHKSLFVAGWRPFAGWVGGIGLGYQFIVYPLLTWNWAILQARGVIPMDIGVPPVLDMELLMVLITGMLGIGGMRSWDKRNGTQTDSLGG